MTKKQLEAPYIPTKALPTTRAQITLSFDSLAFAVKLQFWWAASPGQRGMVSVHAQTISNGERACVFVVF